MRGTKNKSRQQIQDEIDRLKAQYQRVAAAPPAPPPHRNHRGQPRRRAPAGRRDSARAGLPRSEFETVRQQRIAGVEAGKSDPQATRLHRASAATESTIRAATSRYVSTADEQIEDLKKVTLDDVRKFYQQFYGAASANSSISGQFDAGASRRSSPPNSSATGRAPAPTRVCDPYRKVEAVNQKIETPDKQNAFFLAG